MRWIGWRAALAVVLTLVLAAPAPAGPAPTAHAASTFTVNSTEDEPDASPGDGVCASAPSGHCTLRAAVMEANALPGTDTISVPRGTYTVSRGGSDDTGALGDLDLLDSVTIHGQDTSSTIVSGGRRDRVFHVAAPSANVAITGLTVSGGYASAGAGILNDGVLALRDVTLIGNEFGGAGGGLYNNGSATLIDTTIINNHYTGFFPTGAGIANLGSLTATRVVLRGNRAMRRSFGLGGGLSNHSTAQAALTDAIIDDNTASYGGGIYNLGALTLTRVQVSGNAAFSSTVQNPNNGGGIYSTGTLTATNVTVSGNAAEGSGGGILTGAGPTTLTNVTIADNNGGPGSQLSSFGRAPTLKNTIVSSAGGANCMGPPISLGNNLDSGSSCGFDAPGDQASVAPRLAPLAYDGGFSLSRALLPGSPAIDAGANAACPSDDQRGQHRPRDGAGDGAAICDIGAYELQDLPPAVCTPRPLVRVAVARSGPGALSATIAATTPPDSGPNRLRALRIGRVANATVDVGGLVGLGANQTVTLPDGLLQTAMVVHRGASGPSATVELVVVDDCGDWPTFFGGGPDAWGGPSAGAAIPTPAASPPPRLPAPAPVVPAPGARR